jgi:phosphoglycolate phosphatase-like HAD superfamily hydrolase
MYNYIICDLDGTLLDDSGRHYRCYCDIVEKYGGTCIPKEEYWDMKRRKIKRDVLLEKTGFQGTYQQYLDEWIARIEAPEYLRREVPKDGMRQLLKELRSRTEKLYLATMRQNRGQLLAQLDALGIMDCFDKIYSTSPLKEKSKAQLIGTLPNTDKVLVLGDSEADEALADSLGASFWAMTDGLREEKNFSTPYRFASVEEVLAYLNSCPVCEELH